MQEDSDFIFQRFFDSQDAMAVAEHDFVTTEMRLPHELPPWLGELELHRRELSGGFVSSTPLCQARVRRSAGRFYCV